MKKLNYTQMTLRYLREQGLMVDKCECFNPYAGKFGKRKDLFGIFDLIALAPDEIIGVQSTSGNCHSQHRKKILEEEIENAIAWQKAGGKIWLLSWSKKLLKRGGKARRWIPRLDELTEAVRGKE